MKNLNKVFLVGALTVVGALGYKKYKEIKSSDKQLDKVKEDAPYVNLNYSDIKLQKNDNGDLELSFRNDEDDLVTLPYNSQILFFVKDKNEVTFELSNKKIVKLQGTENQYYKILIDLEIINGKGKSENPIQPPLKLKNVKLQNQLDEGKDENTANELTSMALKTLSELKSLKNKKDLAMDIYKVVKLFNKFIKK